MTFLPVDDESEFAFVPDLVVLDVAYKYTGLRDSAGNKILKRITRPVGFTADLDAPQGYVMDHDERREPDDAIDPLVDQGD